MEEAETCKNRIDADPPPPLVALERDAVKFTPGIKYGALDSSDASRQSALGSMMVSPWSSDVALLPQLSKPVMARNTGVWGGLIREHLVCGRGVARDCGGSKIPHEETFEEPMASAVASESAGESSPGTT